jgi:hypothetical protein
MSIMEASPSFDLGTSGQLSFEIDKNDRNANDLPTSAEIAQKAAGQAVMVVRLWNREKLPEDFPANTVKLSGDAAKDFKSVEEYQTFLDATLLGIPINIEETADERTQRIQEASLEALNSRGVTLNEGELLQTNAEPHPSTPQVVMGRENGRLSDVLLRPKDNSEWGKIKREGYRRSLAALAIANAVPYSGPESSR